MLTESAIETRQNKYDSNEIFISRWSPRSMTGEDIDDKDLMAMFEAAHWAPSSYNNQPWRFIYARKGDEYWDTFFDLLSEGNRVWCKNAAILVVVVAKTTFDRNGKPARTHAYDTGAAWGMFALEGASRGLVVHGMQGFDYDKAKEALKLPDEYAVQAMAAVGIQDAPEALPEKQRAWEKPSMRKDIDKIKAHGQFTEDIA